MQGNGVAGIKWNQLTFGNRALENSFIATHLEAVTGKDISNTAGEVIAFEVGTVQTNIVPDTEGGVCFAPLGWRKSDNGLVVWTCSFFCNVKQSSIADPSVQRTVGFVCSPFCTTSALLIFTENVIFKTPLIATRHL